MNFARYSPHSLTIKGIINVCCAMREKERENETLARNMNSRKDQLQNHLPYSTSSISLRFCVCGEYFRTIPICFCRIPDETNDSAEQISAVRRGFDSAITYATLCKNLRRSRDFAGVTINFFFNSAFWISRRVWRMTRHGAATRGID